MNHRVIKEVASRAQSNTLSQTKLLFFGAAGLSFLLSVYLFFSGDQTKGIFVGIWVPSILSAGTLLIGGKNHD